jgi:hypothetical protein
MAVGRCTARAPAPETSALAVALGAADGLGAAASCRTARHACFTRWGAAILPCLAAYSTAVTPADLPAATR